MLSSKPFWDPISESRIQSTIKDSKENKGQRKTHWGLFIVTLLIIGLMYTGASTIKPSNVATYIFIGILFTLATSAFFSNRRIDVIEHSSIAGAMELARQQNWGFCASNESNTEVAALNKKLIELFPLPTPWGVGIYYIKPGIREQRFELYGTISNQPIYMTRTTVDLNRRFAWTRGAGTQNKYNNATWNLTLLIIPKQKTPSDLGVYYNKQEYARIIGFPPTPDSWSPVIKALNDELGFYILASTESYTAIGCQDFLVPSKNGMSITQSLERITRITSLISQI